MLPEHKHKNVINITMKNKANELLLLVKRTVSIINIVDNNVIEIPYTYGQKSLQVTHTKRILGRLDDKTIIYINYAMLVLSQVHKVSARTSSITFSHYIYIYIKPTEISMQNIQLSRVE